MNRGIIMISSRVVVYICILQNSSWFLNEARLENTHCILYKTITMTQWVDVLYIAPTSHKLEQNFLMHPLYRYITRFLQKICNLLGMYQFWPENLTFSSHIWPWRSRSIAPKTIGILTNVFCTSGPNLVILVLMGGELWCGQAQNGVNLDF